MNQHDNKPNALFTSDRHVLRAYWGLQMLGSDCTFCHRQGNTVADKTSRSQTLPVLTLLCKQAKLASTQDSAVV